MPRDIVVVTGATGKQGGATIRRLAEQGHFALRAMTRNRSSEAAKALASLGVEVVVGDLDDTRSLERVLSGAWGVFAMQNTWEAGVKGEEAQGKRISAVARERGVQHFVYSSVGSADRGTGIPHFENKARVEEAVRSAGFPAYTILRPVFFMENLLAPPMQQGDRIACAVSPSTKIQMIAVDDVGRFAAEAFRDPRKWNEAEIDVAGDACTLPEAAAILSRQLGREITFEATSIDAVRRQSEDLAAMFEWFDRTGYSADISSLESRWGLHPLTLAEWAAARYPAPPAPPAPPTSEETSSSSPSSSGPTPPT